MENTQTDEAPVEETGAEENTNANLSIEDLAKSFVEKVDDQPEDTSTTEATEDVTETEVVDAEEELESDDLSQSNEDEDDSEEDAEENAEEVSKPKGLQKALKQINRLTARSKSAEEEVARLKEQIETIKSNPGEPEESASPTLDEINTLKDLEALRKEAQAARTWALKNIRKDYVSEGDKEYTGDDVSNILEQAENYLNELIPQRSHYLQQKQQWAEDTQNVFPYIGEQDGADYEQFLQIRNSDLYKPMLDALPNADFVTALVVEGMKSVKARQKAKPKPKAKTPPSLDPGDGVVPPSESKEVRQKRKKEAALGNGNISVNDFAKLLT